MGWIALYNDGTIKREEDNDPDGRPMQDGKDGKIRAIAQIDYLNSVAVDLRDGIIYFGFETMGLQNGTIEFDRIIGVLQVCEETTIVGDLKHIRSELDPQFNEDGTPRLNTDGTQVNFKTDYETPLEWRPIWFSRYIMTPLGTVVVKVIGLQTTTPEVYGGHNIKKLISLFPDGRVGID